MILLIGMPPGLLAASYVILMTLEIRVRIHSEKLDNLLARLEDVERRTK